MKGSKLASEVKFHLDYFKWNEEEQKGETWKDSVARVMNMHKENPKFKEAFKSEEFKELFQGAWEAYEEKTILGSQRALQFGGKPIMNHNEKMFNCLYSPANRVKFFQECLHFLLCGCGTGFSVQKHHIAQLPTIKQRSNETKVFVIPDTIEGWADSLGVLISSYVVSDATFEEYQNKKVVFDYSLIRPKGAKISGGFKAPGPDGLRKSLEKIEKLLDKIILEQNGVIKPINAYDIVVHSADAVLSGGVRRSATICFFSYDDEEMLNAKTGNWFTENPQRARSNNSVVLHRKKATKNQFHKIFDYIKQFGEPGFFFVDDFEQGSNPCLEIGLYPFTDDGRCGWQGCNLTTMNGGKLNTREKFLNACKYSAVLGTLQAAYTDFVYTDEITKEIFDREALLGCSITGIQNNPQILLDKEILKEGAELIKKINAIVAKYIGINPAARTTCIKPEGNASVLLETASGCHADHAPTYFRTMQVNKESEIAKFFIENYPELIEESVWSENKTDITIFFPIVSNKNSNFKSEFKGLKQLEVVKLLQENWVEPGTNVDLCVKPYIRHNVSNTVEFSNLDELQEYIWDNKSVFTGVSFLADTGDRIYNQAPFTTVYNGEEIMTKYGDAALFASGLIVDGLHVFDNLWQACDLTMNRTIPVEGSRTQVLLKKDWIKRAKQFAKRYFKNDLNKMTICLKDVHLLHKWSTINRILANKEINFDEINLKPQYTDIDTMGAASCYGGACEIPQYK